MGNAPLLPGGGAGGWLFYRDDSTPVVLRLHDARGLASAPGEELVGSICLGSEDGEAASVRREQPACVSVVSGTTMVVLFRSTSVRGEAHGDRVVGEIRLPLAHIASRCGGSLYRVWLPLCAPRTNGRQPWDSADPASQQLPELDAAVAEQFDQAMKNAARDPHLPIVCVSLSRADSPETLDTHMSRLVKAFFYRSLLQSQQQHWRLVQALYRSCRLLQQARGEMDNTSQLLPQFRDALIDSWVGPVRARQMEAASSSSSRKGSKEANPHSISASTFDVGPQFEETYARLRQEIESTTTEANSRINQASDTIRTLKERLNIKQAEHERQRRETARLRREAEALEAENAQLRARLPPGAGPAAVGAEDREAEVRRLKRETEVLAEQKEALVLILEDLYGAVGKDTSRLPLPETPAPAAEQAASSALLGQGLDFGDPLPVPPGPQQEWTNLLPRPSELFASGELEDRLLY